jgi:hypothetical protein
VFFTTVSILGEGQTVSYPKRRSAIREGRYRTPDRQQQIRMREVLKDRFESIPVQVPRSEIEAMGVEIGLEDRQKPPGSSTGSRASRGGATT